MDVVLFKLDSHTWFTALTDIAQEREVTFFQALLPILVLAGLVTFGMIVRPLVYGEDHAFPPEVIFILAAAFAVAQLNVMGFSWKEIETSIVEKLRRAMPAFFILLSIGLIIGSWMVCGTIPMLVYYGLKWIDPAYLYLFAFIVPGIFSILTGTSWGSVGAVGIVIMGISNALGADPGITAGAIIGGACFGDKMSPLSDTTNMAALAAEVDLMDHIQSMCYTTIPSAIVAAAVFLMMGFVSPPSSEVTDIHANQQFLQMLSGMFHFNVLLLIPPLLILYGSIWRKPTVPFLILSTLTACVLALAFQDYSLTQVLTCLKSGFSTDMASQYSEVPKPVQQLLNRGGLYALIEAVIIAFTVFTFIGAMDCINAIPRVVNQIFSWTRSRSTTILSALMATAVTNSLTSNQYATSFIVGDAFKEKFDSLGIPRKVLSRSLEDTGTMLESLVPWTPTALYMMKTLDVSYHQYWHWQLLSLVNFVVAPTLAITGIGCFYRERRKQETN